MGWFGPEKLVESLTGDHWMITRREGGAYIVRPVMSSPVRYLRVHSPEKSASLSIQAELDVRFPVAVATPELFRMLMLRNNLLTYSRWTADLGGSCDVVFYLAYQAIKAGLTPRLFDAMCREQILEREAVHDELCRQFGRFHAQVSYPAAQASVRQVAPGKALPPR